ncbi:ABC transporter ATP-binding protein [Listeria monocytogenes]|nr:ABC transporter ATP-binding protein [Listeria monocytogenes]
MGKLELSSISKNFNEKRIVNNLSFSIDTGDIVGFLGPNGAGKSTTIKMISSILTPDSGTIYFNGQNTESDPLFFKKQLGLVPQEIAIFEDMTAYENIKFFSLLYGPEKTTLEANISEALAIVGLENHKNEFPKNFSGGMKRRLNIACAISHNPSILIMDEPTVGIDPQSRNNILESVKYLNEKGTSILYVSHYMEEIQSICNKVVLLDHGEKIWDGELSSLFSNNPDKTLEEIFLDVTGKDLRDKE